MNRMKKDIKNTQYKYKPSARLQRVQPPLASNARDFITNIRDLMMPFTYIISILLTVFFIGNVQGQPSFKVQEQGDSVVITTAHYTCHIQKNGFRYAFRQPDGKRIAASHPVSGIQIGQKQPPADVAKTQLLKQEKDHVSFAVETKMGIRATINLWPKPHALKIQVLPDEENQYVIVGRTSGIGPAYGLADQAAFGNAGSHADTRPTVELTGFEADTLQGGRMISNFVVFPRQGFGEVNMEPGLKIVRLTEEENVQGSRDVSSMPALYYFVGSPPQIYQAFKNARNEEGYPVFKPKHEWFGVGWEAFGALAWNTNQQTVTENVNRYLAEGYPLDWMVVGSGFWPSGPGEFDEHGTPYTTETASEEAKKLQATTSFGMWDSQLYPDPKGLIDHFHDQGLIFTIGLRIGFIPGGPFTEEGLQQGYYIQNAQGKPRLFEIGFPRVPVYLLNTRNEAATDWYIQLCQKWLDYGIDGFKEDLFGYPQTLPDDLIDPVNRALMDQGVYIMGRNNYLGSATDIHRYDDFNYNQPQDRGPINGLAFAYSGFPYVYPDIIGGTGLATGRFGDVPKSRMRLYLMRYAQYATVNPSMAFGYGPWNFDEETNRVCQEAAQLHHRLKPYIYSNAIRAYQTGFPYTLTPLPLAYPDDENVYGLADTTRRSYEWLIGESLLATPLYGADYATAQTRDVYLPAGTWIDYDSGKKYEGPTTLEDYPLPIGKTPLFVGGTGIVVEEEQGELKGRIYPITQQAEMTFYHLDGETESHILLDNPDWNKVTVTDQTTGKSVSVTKERHAHAFALEPGHNYLVK